MFEMDEGEGNSDNPVKWWECLDNTAAWVRFNYAEIMANGSDELKNAASIVLGGYAPGAIKKEA
ncbi:hypothetical protein [Paenibacillus oryzisoli]|uniref:Uncharacterized protein n=1 Tax=Paenibacillus oryzisoli TaxID=1850517 RepID=A0A198ACL3_9BACL|nr:hypothetical protein [Paenibacillus oryzisoli]OAS19239.1 hypothetical protein A8708_26370 [Paenibacillus oryzisoli]